MSEFIWFIRSDGKGQEPLDLHTCRRFVLDGGGAREAEFGDECVEHYLLPGGERWVRHYGFGREEPDER